MANSKYVVMSGNEVFDSWLIPDTLEDTYERYKSGFSDTYYVEKVMGGLGVTSGWKYINSGFENISDAINSPFDPDEGDRYAFIDTTNTVFAVLHLPKEGYVAEAYAAAYISENLQVMDISDNPDTSIGIGYRLVDDNFIPPEEE